MHDFFEQQDQARSRTGRLIALFSVAVMVIVAALYLVAVGLMAYVGGGPMALWQPGLFAMVALGGLAVIGGGSLTKTAALRHGGHVVAEDLGGRPIEPETTDPDEQRLLNVVDEMAIAAGVPVPPVYVLEEESINAFAAGHSPDDAVIGVTRGTLNLLTRAELQGVVAHEFSHVLNGDMRLNVRLIGVLHGILLLGIIGRTLLYGAAYSGGFGGHRSRDSDSRGRLVILLGGLALLVIGGAGFLCGRLIKSAVSRQREYLADAAAVQFTRNPDGLAGALKKIGGMVQGGKVEAPKAEEASHLFFADALESAFARGRALSTHPPLTERIRRLDPSFDGHFPETRPPVEVNETEAMGLHGASAPARPRADQVTAEAGTLTPEHLADGAVLLASLPDVLREAAHEPLSATALAYALLLDADAEVRNVQQQVLDDRAPLPVREELHRLQPHVDALPRRGRLPVLDLAAPALRRLSPHQYADLSNTIERLAAADQRLSTFEFALKVILEHRLAGAFRDERRRPRVRYTNAKEVHEEIVVLLGTLTRVGHADQADAARAFRGGLARIPDVTGPDVPPAAGPNDLRRALDHLSSAAPRLKEQVVDACAHCVLADEAVTDDEAELLRAVVVALDCPLPPFLARTREEA